MSFASELKDMLRSHRKRGSSFVRALDLMRLAVTDEGRSILWTRFRHGGEVHQTTPFTSEERYPLLFDMAAKLAPEAQRVLSFGCSTGEELSAIRRRFPDAEIVGAEINPRSRRIAAKRMRDDRRTRVLPPDAIGGQFDIVFAMAVLQREPHRIALMGVTDLSPYYPHRHFDAALRKLSGLLRKGGLLCVANAQYRVEDSSVGDDFEPIGASPAMEEPIFGPDGRLREGAPARTIFRKVGGGTAPRG